jgi:hypothetical protein
MKKILILLLFIANLVNAQVDTKIDIEEIIKDNLKFSTFYAAVNGGTSLSDVKVFSVNNGLSTQTISTSYDYNFTIGLRKIARFGYENKAQTFYDGTESNYSDAATVGKVRGVEYMFEVNMKRQEGIDYMDQHHFIRYSSDDDCEDPLCVNYFAIKVEYLQDGFADVEYFEASQRFRYKKTRDLSFNIGAVQRLSEPYGYDPLGEWILPNNNLHYTYLAIQEGYTIDVQNSEYFDPSGVLVATSPEVWEAVVVPEMLSNYVTKKRDELEKLIQHSLVVGFDYYKYSKKTWLHVWGNLMPWHYNDGSEFSYHNFITEEQWYDYSGGLIYGIKQNRNLGYFIEGKYNKYWNREWYDFKFGINYTIF